MHKLTAPPTGKGPAERFTGEVWFDQIYRGEEPSRARVNAVHFAPCARSACHTHAVGQTLHPRDRSLITCAALVTNRSTEQLRSHLAIGIQNGMTEGELKEMIIHLAFYAGWPRAMSAITVARDVFGGTAQ
jgi:alkylhydroperoxidase/carboxymuconolactone decarboxylase family protein YurZ